MSDDIEKKVRKIAADVFNLPAGQMTRETSPASVANWDSVQQLNFVLALEEAFGVQLEPEEIDRLRTIGAAIDLLEGKVVGSGGGVGSWKFGMD